MGFVSMGCGNVGLTEGLGEERLATAAEEWGSISSGGVVLGEGLENSEPYIMVMGSFEAAT